MRLPPEQVKRFYGIWMPLLLFVNKKLRVEPSMFDATVEGPWDPRKVLPIRDALWADDSVREAFIAENPAGLSAADLAIVDSWRHRVAGEFYVFRHLKKHSILIGGSPERVYGVLGLASSLDQILPFTPCYAKAVLLPFEGPIIFDSLIVPYNIYLGPGIRRRLDSTYKDAKERGAIITSLPPSSEESPAAAGDVTARVLEEFRKHLYRSGLGPKVVERDVAAVAAFGDHLARLPEPGSLRDFGDKEVRDYLAVLLSEGLKETQRKQRLTGLTRLLRFLRDTERMDYHGATDVLYLLRGRERE